MDFTSRLALNKPNPDPVTGDIVDITKLNENADKIDGAISATVCTSSTRPATPFQGQIIAETDTNKLYVRIGTTWFRVFSENASVALTTNGEINVTRAAATDTAYYAIANGDTVGRLLIRADGQINWGPGNGSRDVNLYRVTAGLLGTDDAFQAAGAVAGAAYENIRTTPSASIAATETVIQSLTFPAVVGLTYNVTAVQSCQGDAANVLALMRLRWATGSTLTTAGTRLLTILPNADVANRGQAYTMVKSFTPGVTGNVTVGVTLQRSGSTGNVLSYGAADSTENIIMVTGA